MSFLKYNGKLTFVNVVQKKFSMSALLSVKVTPWTHLACFTRAAQLRIKKPSLNLRSRVPCHPRPWTQDSGKTPDSGASIFIQVSILPIGWIVAHKQRFGVCNILHPLVVNLTRVRFWSVELGALIPGHFTRMRSHKLSLK